MAHIFFSFYLLDCGWLFFVCHSFSYSCDHSMFLLPQNATANQNWKDLPSKHGDRMNKKKKEQIRIRKPREPNDSDTMTFWTRSVQKCLRRAQQKKRPRQSSLLFRSSNKWEYNAYKTNTHWKEWSSCTFHQIFVNANKLNCCLWKWIWEPSHTANGHKYGEMCLTGMQKNVIHMKIMKLLCAKSNALINESE